MDLFSAFDPQTVLLGIILALNWSSSMLGFYYLPHTFWLSSNRYKSLFLMILSYLSNEFKLIMKGTLYSGYLLFVSLFTMIFFNNFMGLFPYIFTSTSHLTFTLTFSLTLWLSFMFFGWFNFAEDMLCHLVPSGTPVVLMPFMVCIETISNLIRSGTLAIRLSANMISGHLLLNLMGSQGPKMNLIVLFFFLFAQLLLLILEFSVSIIQSYVFSVLSSLYSGESVGSK